MFKFISIYLPLLLIFSTALTQEQKPDPNQVVPFFKLEEKPTILKKVPPVYPEFAIKAGVEGQVIVKVIIDQDGKVTQANILKSVPMLDEAAITAVKQWEFSPGKMAGVAVRVNMIVPVQFKRRK